MADAKRIEIYGYVIKCTKYFLRWSSNSNFAISTNNSRRLCRRKKLSKTKQMSTPSAGESNLSNNNSKASSISSLNELRRRKEHIPRLRSILWSNARIIFHLEDRISNTIDSCPRCSQVQIEVIIFLNSTSEMN